MFSVTEMSHNDSMNNDLCLHNGSQAGNQTPCIREDEPYNDDVDLLSYWLHVFITCGLLVSPCCSLIAVRIMLRCRKLSISIRYLSVNFLIAFVMVGISTFLCNIAMRINGQNSPYYQVMFVYRMILFSVFMSVLCCCNT